MICNRLGIVGISVRVKIRITLLLQNGYSTLQTAQIPFHVLKSTVQGVFNNVAIQAKPYNDGCKQ